MSLSEADIACNSASVSFFSQLHVCSSFQPESRICMQSLVLKIIPRPGTELPVPRNLFPWEPFQSPLCVKNMSCLLLAGQSLMKLVSLSWLFCWPPGMWRTWGSEGSSLSPSGCRFWTGPVQNRIVWGAPCSPLWWLWSCGQDLPAEEEKRYYQHKIRVASRATERPELSMEVIWYLPLAVHHSRRTRRKFSWLWWPVLRV